LKSNGRKMFEIFFDRYCFQIFFDSYFSKKNLTVIFQILFGRYFQIFFDGYFSNNF